MSLFSRKTRSGQKLWVRVVALALAALMLVGVIYMAIAMILSGSAAEGELESYGFECSVEDEEFYVAVGIRYGSSVTVSHSFTAPFGFVVGEAYIEKGMNRSFSPLYFIDSASVVVACDGNLTALAGNCTLATSKKKTDIGAYHVELTLTEGDVWNNLSDLSDIFSLDYEHVFPAYVDGVKSIRIGSYYDYTAANEAAAQIGAGIDGFNISIASPSSTGITVLNSDCDTILFEHSDANGKLGAILPQQPADEEKVYTLYQTTGYVYPGAFCFRRYITDEYNGLTLINLVDLQSYVEGVVPSEIITSWPLETQKAFAVTVRSFTMGNLGLQYAKYGFDLKNTSDNQTYKGRNHVTDRVIQAVAETKDIILTCDNELITGYYASSQGGWAVDSKYVWSGETGPYIINQPTPWEKYTKIKRGFWSFEMTQKELLTAFDIYNSGDKVSDVSYEFAGDSPYIYSMTVTDSKGESATIRKCSKVKGVMDNYGAYSANFLIAKGSIDYTYDNVISTKIITLNSAYAGDLNVYTSEGVAFANSKNFNFFTSIGKALSDASSSLYVQTSSGTAILNTEIDIPVTSKPDKNGIYTYVCDYGKFLIVTELQQVTETFTASSSSNYIIVGRGWGHGVGVSQYGTAHLGQAGATYDQIIGAYYPNTDLVNLYDFLA